MKNKSLLAISSFVLLLLSFMACNNNGGATITLTATNCKADDISIRFENVIVLKEMGTPYVVQTTVVVTCAGEPLSGAEAEVKWPWLSNVDPYKATTGPDGKIGVKKDNLGSDPTGKTIVITVKGSDKEKQETLTLPAPNQ